MTPSANIVTNEDGFFVFTDTSDIIESKFYSIMVSAEYYDGSDFSYNFCEPGGSAVIPSFKDGWYTYFVTILMNYSWYSYMTDKGMDTSGAYIEKDGFVYKSENNKLVEISAKDIIYEYSKYTTTKSEYIIRIYTLQNRLIAISKNIINSNVASRYKTTITTNDRSSYVRDMLSTGIEAMQYSIDYGMWNEAQAITVNLLSCSNFYETLISKYYGCRCIKI